MIVYVSLLYYVLAPDVVTPYGIKMVKVAVILPEINLSAPDKRNAFSPSVVPALPLGFHTNPWTNLQSNVDGPAFSYMPTSEGGMKGTERHPFKAPKGSREGVVLKKKF